MQYYFCYTYSKVVKAMEKLVILSIQSYYANQIFSSTKFFEFRKRPLKESILNKDIYIYSAKDDKAIIGTLKVSSVLVGNMDEILKETGYDTRNDKDEIINYFKDAKTCYALKLYDVKKFKKPISLNELKVIKNNITMPQFYKYIYEGNPLYDYIIKKSKD